MKEETLSIKNLSVLSLPLERLWTISRVGVICAFAFLAGEAALYNLNPFVSRYLMDVLVKGYNIGWEKPLPYHIWFIPKTMTCGTATTFLTVLMAILAVSTYASYNRGSLYAKNATERSQVTFGAEMFKHILDLGMDFHAQTKKGEIQQKTDNVIYQTTDFLYNSFFGDFLRGILSIVFALVMMATIDLRLFFLSAFAIMITLYTSIVFGSRVGKEQKSAWKIVNITQVQSLDVINNIIPTKHYCNEEYEANRRKEIAEKQLVPLRRISVLWRWLTTSLNFWETLFFLVAMLAIVLARVKAHQSTIGEIPRFLGAYLILFKNYMTILFKYLNAQNIVPKVADLKKIRDVRPTVVDAMDAVVFPGLKKEITFEEVGFAYALLDENLKLSKMNQRGAILANVNLAIPKGKLTALTGRTGCGKSTLMHLLNRLHEPTSGTIRVDGIDIRRYTQKSYRRAFTNLPQKAYLYCDTVRYNIAYSRIDALEDLEGIMEAAKTAQIHEFVTTKLPHGYDTIINERGANISGGEEQRISLARAAFAKDAEIVILDEPTNNLDARTAKSFFDRLMAIFAGKTIVIIAHDRDILKQAHRVVFIEHGRVSEVGLHSELIADCENYKNMVLAN